GHLPLLRGISLTKDDEIRRNVITQLICHFELKFATIETRWDIKFTDYFANALERLTPMQEDGLLTVNSNGIEVHPRGRLLIRNICMVFDAYRSQKSLAGQFSKVI
ncbi:coproporphyrinogen III oxidase, partial [Achromatium sp. WMS1]